MSYNRPQITRRDANEKSLTGVARGLGIRLVQVGPLDFWGWFPRRDEWLPIEIKLPEREGHKNEYTEAQKEFLALCEQVGMKRLIWRTEDDVLRDCGGRAA